MNIETLKLTLGRSFGKANLQLQKHSPEILLGVGIIGGIVTTGLAIKATYDGARDILDDHQDKIEKIDEAILENDHVYTDQDILKSKVIVYTQTSLQFAKLYGPSVGLGVLSIAAILSSHGVMANRQVSLAAAYNLVVNGFKSYRDRVVEEFGLEKDEMFRLGLREEEYKDTETDEEGKTKKVKKTRLVFTSDPTMYTRLFDASNPNWKNDVLLNMAWLEGQQRWFNDKLIIRGYLFLNEVYEDLGFPSVPEGQLVGWVLRTPEEMKDERRDGYISLGMDNDLNKSGLAYERGGIVLNPNVDGVVYDLI